MEKTPKAATENHDEKPAQSLAVKRGQMSMKVDLEKMLEEEERQVYLS